MTDQENKAAASYNWLDLSRSIKSFNSFIESKTEAEKSKLAFSVDVKANGDTQDATGDLLQIVILAYSMTESKAFKAEGAWASRYFPGSSKPYKILPSLAFSYGLSEEDFSKPEYSGKELGKEEAEEIWEALHVIASGKFFAVAYNFSYVFNVLNKVFKKFGLKPQEIPSEASFPMTASVMELAKKLVPVEKIGDYKQASLFYLLNKGSKSWMKCYNDYFAPGHFWTFSDCSVNFKMALQLGSMAGCKSVFEIPRIMSRKVEFKKMPFGKYRNSLIQDLAMKDPQYLMFLVSKEDFLKKYPDLSWSIHQCLEKAAGSKSC